MLSIKSSTLPNFSKCYQNYSQSKSLVKRKAFQESPSLKSNVRNTSISTRIKCETSLEQESTQSVNVEFYSDQLVKLLEQKSTYRWKDSIVNYVKSGEGPPLLLIHGFGASIGHWRKNIPVLSESYTVYAIDLLGQGSSDKPPKYQYTIELWAELVLDFLSDVVKKPSVLVGNSIGSLIALTATADASRSLVSGTVLLNCAGGMNNKAITDDWRIKLALPIFWLIDWLLLQQKIAQFLFNKVKSRENIKNILQSVYSNKEAVDDELVQIILEPSETRGALDAFVSIITGPPGPRPEKLIPKISNPLLILWGDEDPFTPMDGPVGKFFKSLPSTYSNVEFVVLNNVGHCPHDDRPEIVNEKIMLWLKNNNF